MTSASMTSLSSLLLPSTSLYSTLGVTAGLHRGVVIPLEQSICRIGSAQQADVILSDVGIADEHVILRFHGRMVAIEALGGDVEVGEKYLKQGTGWRTQLPVTISFGDVRLQLSRPEFVGPPALQSATNISRSIYQSMRKSAGIACSSIRRNATPLLQSVGERKARAFDFVKASNSPLLKYPLAASVMAAGHTRRFGTPIVQRIAERIPRVPDPLQTPRSRGVAVSALFTIAGLLVVYAFIDTDKAGANISASALHSTAELNPQAAQAALALAASVTPPSEALRQQLSQAGLDSLQVNDAGSHLVVSGEFAPDRYTAWNDVQRWFDQQYGSQKVLISDAKPSPVPDEPAFEFQAVWFGDKPYVIDASGARLYPGAAVQQGWVLSEISDNRVMLRRGDEELSLTL